MGRFFELLLRCPKMLRTENTPNKLSTIVCGQWKRWVQGSLKTILVKPLIILAQGRQGTWKRNRKRPSWGADPASWEGARSGPQNVGMESMGSSCQESSSNSMAVATSTKRVNCWTGTLVVSKIVWIKKISKDLVWLHLIEQSPLDTIVIYLFTFWQEIPFCDIPMICPR